jgi:hypothetical protein
MFTQPVRPNSNIKSFTCFLLSEDVIELFKKDLEWEQIKCPMSFPQCHYDWCVTGDNNAMVNMTGIYDIYIYLRKFFSFRMMNSLVN